MQPEAPSDTSSRSIRWNSTTKLVISIFLLVLGIIALYLFRSIFVPLIVGGIMAYILQPVVRLISRVARLPHKLATAIVYLILLAIVVSTGASLAPVIVGQVNFLLDEFVGFIAYLDTVSAESVQFMGFEFGVQDLVDQVSVKLTELASSAATESIGIIRDVAETFLLTIFVFLIAFYLTRDASGMRDAIEGMIPDPFREDIDRLVDEIDKIWGAFFRGQIILSVVVMGLMTAVSAAIGLPQPILMGVLAGLMEFLPSVGHAIWLVVALIVALVEGSTYLPISNFAFALLIAGVHFVYTQTDLNFLIPRIIGRQVHLHPTVVIIGIIVGASVGGVLGIALAAPTIASLRVIGRYVYARLLDLEPFPMVGPIAAPVTERQAEAKRLATQPLPSPPSPREVLEQIRSRHVQSVDGEPISHDD